MLALLGLDVGNYFAHYRLHRFDVLWQFHKIHHSSREQTGSQLSVRTLANREWYQYCSGAFSVCLEMVLLK